jgi:hypothetical protein
MAVWSLILAWWRRRQRMTDLEILWPICLEQATDIDHARAAFAMHCFQDPAWLALGEDRMIEFIESLEGYD